MHNPGIDIRDIVFKRIKDKEVTAQITVERDGIIAGSKNARKKLEELAVNIDFLAEDGQEVCKGETIAKFKGNPRQITTAEDVVMGNLTKPSGIATASRKATELAAGKIRVVSGAWKKMPLEIKQVVRDAIKVGGVSIRIADTPFVYLDKNYVRIFGGIKAALEAASQLPERLKAIQLRGETGDIRWEAKEAVAGGAHILMVDTGNVEDAIETIETLKTMGIREGKQVAFAGGVKIPDIPKYAELGIDILDIGTQIIDAPLLDMKMDVISS
ncbi:MAG: putative nicotinate-nucleotide pyrophosphorylase [Clostridiales bacterium]|jgi:nicotinate-nucleotide pyrophosphorylase (carboxylating)|nr:putative nicotinate-nucleotide pyrophosphorylase [Clostridiales bacterium]